MQTDGTNTHSRLGPGRIWQTKPPSLQRPRIHCLGMLREPWGAQSIPASTRRPTLYIPREHPQPHTLFRNSTLGLRQLLGKASSEEAPKPEELACASVWVEGSSSATSASSALHCSPLFLAPALPFVVLQDPVVPLGLGQLQCGMPDPSQLRFPASTSIAKC